MAKQTGTLRVLNRGGKSAEVMLYGIIGADYYGDGVTSKKFANEIKALGNVNEITLRINSEGGVVTEARAMYNTLVQHPANIFVQIDGIAASAASFLAMAGDTITIAEGGFFMIHNARAVAIGEAEDMRRMADVLDLVNQTIRDTYIARTGIDEAKIKKWMDSEKWMDGNEAVALGFADSVLKNQEKVAACISAAPWIKNLPASLRPNRAAAIAARERVRAA